MTDPFSWLFDTSGFTPRARCGDWSAGMIALHAGSDILIWLAYISVPLVLGYFARQRGVGKFNRLVWLFAAFILACGFSHFVEALMFRYPVYRLSGVVKAATAVISWATVIALIPAVPGLLNLLRRVDETGAADQAVRDAATGGRRWYWAYLLAAGAAGVAVGVRALLSPLLVTTDPESGIGYSDHALVLPLLAVVFVAWARGFGPALVTLLLSLVAFVALFIPTAGGFAVQNLSDQLAVGAFLFCGVGAALLGEAQRQNQRRADRHLAEVRGKQAELEAEIARREGVEAELRRYAADLTEAQRRTVEALALLDTFVKNTPVGLAFFDRDRRAVFVNRYLVAGERETDSRVGRGPADALPGFPAAGAEVVSEVAASGLPVTGRTVTGGPAGDGTAPVWQVSCYPVRGADDRPVGVGLVAENVSDRVDADRRLRASERRFRELAEAMPHLVRGCRPDGGCDYLSRQWQDYTGRPAAAGLGDGWLDVLHPDDRPAAAAAWRAAVDGRAGYAVEYRIRRHDGAYRWFTARGVPVRDDAGRVERWFVSCTDIHDRKVAEDAVRRSRDELEERVADRTADLAREREFLRAVLENVEDGIVACDAAGRPTLFNRAAVALHGPPADPDPGNQWADHHDLYHPDGVTRLARAEVPLFRALAGEHVRGVEVVAAPPGRPARTLVAAGQPLVDDRGRRLGAVVSLHDVTDRKRAEAARAEVIRADAAQAELKRSEEQFRLLADSLPQLAWMARPDGHIFWYNRRWYDYTGTTLAEMAGWGWEAVHDPAVLPRVADRWAASLATGEPFEMVFPLKGKDGRFRHFLTRAASVRGADGRVVYWFGTNTDVEDQRLAEERVRASEARFRRLADAMPQIVWVTRPDGYHEYYNRRWYEYTGVPDGSADGEGWNGLFHPADRDLAWDRWRHSLATGDPYEIEYRLRRHDGAYRWFLGRALPQRDDAGAVAQWFGTCTDIDDQKRAEQNLLASEARFRVLTEAIPQIVWNAAPAGGATYFNARWREYTGLPADAARGDGWVAAAHPDDAPRLAAGWRAAVDASADRFAQEVRHRRAADGAYRWFLAVAVPLRRADGSIDQWIGSMADVHDQKEQALVLEGLVHARTAALRAEVETRRQAEEAAEALSAELRRSNGELEKFAYVASHDLQEPLRKIQAFGDRLNIKNGPQLDDGGRDYLGRMMASAARMRVLINDLLAFSRVTTKGQPFAPTDLAAAAAAVVDDLADRIDRTGGTVDVGPLPTIDADPTQMRQLLQNLIGNGLKFHKPDETPAITVRAEVLPADDVTGDEERVRIAVSDNGIGFDEKYLDRIFQVFQRLHGRAEYEGTGVGLAICRKIAERHRGDITARSRPGDGATFLVTLPVRQPTPSSPPRSDA